MEDMQAKIETMRTDKEKWERLAKSRETKMKQMEKTVRKLEIMQEEVGEDMVSEAGFSEISDVIQDVKDNALDIVINSGKIEYQILNQHFFPSLPAYLAEQGLMTAVLIDFHDFDTVSSRTASGLEPRYDSIVTHAPFAVNEQVIKSFNTGSIKFSLQAFQLQGNQGGQQAPVVIGEATVPLVSLLDCTPMDPQPIISGTLKFQSKKDPNVPIAHLQYKLKLRHSIVDLIHQFMTARNVEEVNLQLSRADFDPVLLNQVQQLFVQVFQISGFTRLPSHILDSGRVFVQYSVFGYEQPVVTKSQRFSNIGSGTARFDEDKRLPVRVSEPFLLWIESGKALHIGVYVENTKNKIGECKIPLKPLLRDSMSVVRGNFTMKGDLLDPRSVPVGAIDVAVRWVDVDRSKVVAQQALSNKPVTMEKFFQVMERFGRRLQQQRIKKKKT